jgi:hypothetical protein
MMLAITQGCYREGAVANDRDGTLTLKIRSGEKLIPNTSLLERGCFTYLRRRWLVWLKIRHVRMQYP